MKENPEMPKIEKNHKKESREWQLDFLKTLSMMLIITDHSFSHSLLRSVASPIWERIAIPIFLVIMGYNTVKSFEHRKVPLKLKELYSKDYFIRKIERYVIPYMILYFVHLITYLIVRIKDLNVFLYPWGDNKEWLFVGYTPFYGPGMWFMPLLMSSILGLPLLYYCFKKHAFLTLVFSILIEIGLQLLKYYIEINIIDGWKPTYVIKELFIYRVSGFALGMWISRNNKLLSKNSIPILLLNIPSAIYIYYSAFVQDFLNVLNLQWVSSDYHFLTFPWGAFLFLIFMNFLPKNPGKRIKNFFKSIGSSTYHILMFQMFYFSIIYHFYLYMSVIWDYMPHNYVWYFPVNLMVTFCIGIILRKVDSKFMRSREDNKFILLIYKIEIGISISFLIIREILQYGFLLYHLI